MSPFVAFYWKPTSEAGSDGCRRPISPALPKPANLENNYEGGVNVGPAKRRVGILATACSPTRPCVACRCLKTVRATVVGGLEPARIVTGGVSETGS